MMWKLDLNGTRVINSQIRADLPCLYYFLQPRIGWSLNTYGPWRMTLLAFSHGRMLSVTCVLEWSLWYNLQDVCKAWRCLTMVLQDCTIIRMEICSAKNTQAHPDANYCQRASHSFGGRYLKWAEHDVLAHRIVPPVIFLDITIRASSKAWRSHTSLCFHETISTFDIVHDSGRVCYV